MRRWWCSTPLGYRRHSGAEPPPQASEPGRRTSPRGRHGGFPSPMRTTGRKAAASWRGSSADGAAGFPPGRYVPPVCAFGLRIGVCGDRAARPAPLMPRLSWLMDLLLGIAITYGVLYALLVIDGGRLKFFDAAGILLARGSFSNPGAASLPAFSISFSRRGHAPPAARLPCDKNFDFFTTTCKKILFNLEKMGYNTMENAVCADRCCAVQRRELVCASNARHF